MAPHSAKQLGLTLPPGLLSIAGEVSRCRTEQLRYKSRMSEITKDTHATLHQLVAGEDTIKEEGRLGDLVLRYIRLSSSQRPEYFIMIGQTEYLPKQIERWARDFWFDIADRRLQWWPLFTRKRQMLRCHEMTWGPSFGLVHRSKDPGNQITAATAVRSRTCWRTGAARAKTERLKALRLAKEAQVQTEELPAKPTKRRTTPRNK
jgi:hypothetical protein